MASLTTDSDAQWPILEAAFLSRDHVALIRALEAGVSPDARDDCGSTLLMHACGTADLATIFVLLAFGADWKLANWENEDAAGYLCAYNDKDEGSRLIVARALIGLAGNMWPAISAERGYKDSAISSGLMELANVL